MAYASTYDESAFGGGGGDGELIKLLVGSRARRSRLRRLLLAKLIRGQPLRGNRDGRGL